MSLWSEILQHAANANSAEAYRLLNFEMLLLLRAPGPSRGGDWQYTGPVPKIVRIFIASLPDADRGMAKSRAADFIDYICDLILAKLRRSVSLVEFCQGHPELSVEELAQRFPGWDGLKLGKEDRAKWINKHLRSMAAAGIEINSVATQSTHMDPPGEEELYRYHELALVNKWKAELSWKDFKEQEEIDRSYVSITDSDSDEDPGVGEEAFDYGAIIAAQVVLNLSGQTTEELAVDFNRLGEQLTSDLLGLLETFHAQKPSDGYFPIAWHNVWWSIASKYEAVPLDLCERDPFCEVDRTLADYIGDTYPVVIKPSRLNIFRRRTRFQDKCIEHAQSVLIAWNETGS